MNMTNADFLAATGLTPGNMNFSGSGDLLNEGEISAEAVYLVGENVTNTGSISGEVVVLAAGDSVVLGQPGSDVFVQVTMADPAVHVVDTGGSSGTGPGTINAAGGNIVLAAGDIFSTALEGIESLRAEAKRDVVLEGDVVANSSISVEAGRDIALNGDLKAGDPTADDPSIYVRTTDGGDITTRNLEVRGRGYGSITVDASGNLEIIGDTDIDIRSNPDQEEAIAEVLLTAGKTVVINGDVDAEARGRNYNYAHFLIEAGKDADSGYDATINGNLDAWAHTAAHGESDALIELYASGNVILNGTEDPFAHAGKGNGRAQVQGDFEVPGDEEGEELIEDERNTYHAQVIIGSGGLPSNHPPLAVGDGYSVNKNDILNVEAVDGVLDNDTDEDSDPLAAVLVDGPAHGTLTLNPDGSFIYTPDEDYVGPDSFTYKANDGDLDSGVVEVIITVNPDGNGGNGDGIFPQAAPLPKRPAFDVEGCPALMEWLAGELGVEKDLIEIYLKNILAYSPDIHPCEMCARLNDAATTLRDSEGARIAALAQIVNEFVAPGAPIAPEQMALIASAITSPEAGTHYAAAGEWLDALVEYMHILNTEMGYSAAEAVAFTGKYTAPITTGDNVNLAAYVQARLGALSSL